MKYSKIQKQVPQFIVRVLTGLWDEQYDQNMRWWDSKPQSVTDKLLYYVTYCYVIHPTLPATLVPTVATTRVHPPKNFIVIKVLCFSAISMISIIGRSQVSEL